MMHGVLPRALLAAVLLLTSLQAFPQADVPHLAARVTDLTGTLAADQRAALEQKLAALEARKGSQVAVLLVPTVQPEAIEQYAIRVFDQWKLGRQRVDDGVLLVVAKNDRKLRIEVGRGLEGAIPDAIAKRIIDEDITPRFRQGDFYGGISVGVDRIGRLVEGESMPAPVPARSSPPGKGVSGDLILFGFFAALALAAALQSALGRLGGSAAASVVAGLAVFFLWGLGLALLLAIGVFVLSLFTSFSGGSNWSSGGGGWSSGGRGGYSGGGGFGGGGGGSAGGGASGSW